jgi:hypothetical protein
MSAKKKKTTTTTKTKAKGLRYTDVLALAKAIGGLEESTSYGTPALKAKRKLVTRLKEDGVTLVVRVDPAARDALMSARPKTFFVTDHYLGSPFMLVDLASAKRDELRALLEDAVREATGA